MLTWFYRISWTCNRFHLEIRQATRKNESKVNYIFVFYRYVPIFLEYFVIFAALSYLTIELNVNPIKNET